MEPLPHSETVVTVFSSIQGIAQSLRSAEPNLPLVEVEDPALGGYGGTVDFDPSKLSAETRTILREAKILVSEPAVVAALLECDASALESLTWCQSTYAGVDPMFTANLALPLPWKLTRFAGCFGPPIAEWCLARIIAHERNFAASADDQNRRSWAGSKEAILGYRYLSSLTLSVLGCGDIGRCVAKAAKAFGMHTIGYGKTKRSKDALAAEGIDEYTENLKRALQEADYIVSVLPSTPDTRGMLSDLGLMPASKSRGGKCPVFLNVGRGDVITETSLIHALDTGYISAAILDVFETEPLPSSSGLWDRPDVIVSPHVSGLTQGKDVPRVFMENYRRYVAGREMKYVVDWKKGY
ncbi:hypothetical protein ACHAXT_013100 [Thalassiosira profunda]